MQYAPFPKAKPAGGNPFAAAAAAPTPAAAPASPAAAAPSGPIATKADVSAAVFAGVSETEQIAAIRKLYEVVNPDKMAQVRFCTASLSCSDGR